MKKKSLLLAVSAMAIAAIGVGTVETFAWYQVTSELSVSTAGDDISTITVSETTLDAGQYQITFNITDQSANIDAIAKQLSYNDGGTLKVGAYNSGTSGVRESTASAASDVLQPIGVTAAWKAGKTPVGGNADDVAYLRGKTLKGATLVAGGNVKLTNDDDAVTSITDYTTVYIKIAVADADSLGLTVTLWADAACSATQIANTDLGARIATNNRAGAEFVTAAEIEAHGSGSPKKLFGQSAANTDAGAVYHYSESGQDGDSLGIASDVSLTIS